MSDAAQTFLQIGPNAALGADEHHWILYRAGQPVSYVRSTKAILLRCIREKGIQLSAEGRAALDALADDFNAWKANPTRRGTPIAPWTEMPLERAEIGFLPHSETRGTTMIERLGPECAIGTDGLQWIVYAKRAAGPNTVSVRWQSEAWKPVAYVAFDKHVLI